MALSDFSIIRKSLSARLFSTSVTVSMVAIAVALMLTLLSMRDAGEQAFQRGTGNAHLLISRDSSPLVSVLNSLFYANPPARSMTLAEYEQITARFPSTFAVPTQLGDSYQGRPVLATTKEFFTGFSPNPSHDPTAGTLGWSFASGRAIEAPFEVVVGAEAARASGLRLGDSIEIAHGYTGGKRFQTGSASDPHVHAGFPSTIVGILEPTGTAHDRALFADLRASWIIHADDRRKAEDPGAPRPTEADLLPADKLLTGILVGLPTRPGQTTSSILPEVFTRLRTDPSITVANPADQISTLFQIVGDIDQILVAMAAVVMLSSGISIMLALYNTMEQRRRQIAILRVLGASAGRVFGLIVTESAVIGIAGVLAGLGLAFVGTEAVSAALRDQLGIMVDPVFEPRTIAIVVFATIVISSAAGLVPGLVAYRVSVADRLRPIA